ncbi:hypothetical protein OIDMADRAFT_52699 [Oidiodendron maius Zn]|uniref:Uncharacterized protein n=1 Tax=Oidiodendron maius (strain Zn) TaxID=913774 RepID=A0A0C3DLG3_OIDMZ|nr:hypothetical protein OIDMADRAFT_52699 [Oidiodendron maius Zn]
MNKNLRSLILGGVDSKLDEFQYGGKAIQEIGTILNTPNIFIGPEATLSNFRQIISTSDLLHIHLHSNFILRDRSASASTSTAPEDSAFTTYPLNQAIVFNSSASDGSNELSADSILTRPFPGLHTSTASGQQGKLHNASSGKLSQ